MRERLSQQLALCGKIDDLEDLIDSPILLARRAREQLIQEGLSPAKASSRLSDTVSCSNTVGL